MQTISTLLIFGPLSPLPPAPPQASHTPFARGVSGVSASAVVRYRCMSQDGLQSRVSDDAYVPLPKIPNRNLQPSSNKIPNTGPSLPPKNSSPLLSLGRTLGQVHQSTNALRAADYRPHPLWLWHASCNHADYDFRFSTPLPFLLFITSCPFSPRCHIFDSVSFF